MKYKLMLSAMLLAVGMVLPAMAQDSTGSSLGGLKGNWILVSYGAPDAQTSVLETTTITAEFSEEGIRGSAGCNTYFGTFKYDNTTLAMSPLASTRKACDEAGMEQETAFLAALQAASSYQLTGGQLLINYEGGILTFAVDNSVVEPTPIPDTGDSSLGGLAGSWILVSYGSAQAVLPEPVITAKFAAQGVSGSAGCNSYIGDFGYNNGALTISALANTEKACVDSAVTDQETAYLDALRGATTYQFVDGQLLINYEGGILAFTRDTSAVEPTAIPDTGDPSLGGLAGSWILLSYGAVDAPVEALEAVPITAEFSATGIKGSAGCNTYFGTFTFANQTLTLSPLASTLLTCPDPAVVQQESDYLAALQSAAGYQVGGGQLTVNYEGGVLTYMQDTTASAPTPIPDTGDSSLGGLAGSWSLVSYDGGQLLLPDFPITADFTAQGISGSSGCNNYSGTFTYNNGTVTFGELISTQKACEPNVMEQEAAYLEALSSTASYSVSKEQLTIGYEGGALVFEAQ
ncbi:MAG: META domain-containing protein [Anaerolineae bacterium]